MAPEEGHCTNKYRQLPDMRKKKGKGKDLHTNKDTTHSFQAQDGLLHTTHVSDMVFIWAELSLLNPFIDACHHLSGDVCSIIHTWGEQGLIKCRSIEVRTSLQIPQAVNPDTMNVQLFAKPCPPSYCCYACQHVSDLSMEICRNFWNNKSPCSNWGRKRKASLF